MNDGNDAKVWASVRCASGSKSAHVSPSGLNLSTKLINLKKKLRV